MNALPSAGGVRRRPKKVPLSFSALARGALQAPGCAEDRHSPPAGPPEGRRRQWCARRIDDERTWVKQRDTKGSWIVDRGSKIQNVLFAWDNYWPCISRFFRKSNYHSAPDLIRSYQMDALTSMGFSVERCETALRNTQVPYIVDVSSVCPFRLFINGIVFLI